MRRMWRSDVSASASAPPFAPPLILAPARTPTLAAVPAPAFSPAPAPASGPTPADASAPAVKSAYPHRPTALDPMTSRERSPSNRVRAQSGRSGCEVVSRETRATELHPTSRREQVLFRHNLVLQTMRSCSCSWACPWFCSCSCTNCAPCLARPMHMPAPPK